MTAQACQSCGMPLNDQVLGTEANGAKSEEYCTYCYENGAFKQPELTLQQMIDLCVPFMVEEGMAEAEARAILSAQLPVLKRWQGATAG